MQLTDNDAFRPVDNKCARLRHNRQLAQKDFLLKHHLLAALAGSANFFKAHKTKQRLERCGIGHTAIKAFLYPVFGRRQRILNKLEARHAVGRCDWKQLLKYLLQTGVVPIARRRFPLQKISERLGLNFNQVGQFEHVGNGSQRHAVLTGSYGHLLHSLLVFIETKKNDGRLDHPPVWIRHTSPVPLFPHIVTKIMPNVKRSTHPDIQRYGICTPLIK